MKINVLTHDNFNNEYEKEYEADDFDLDDSNNLHILRNGRSIAIIVNGRWLGVAEIAV